MAIFLHLPPRIGEEGEGGKREEEVNNFVSQWPGDDKIDCLALVASLYHTHTHTYSIHTHTHTNTQIITVSHPLLFPLGPSRSAKVEQLTETSRLSGRMRGTVGKREKSVTERKVGEQHWARERRRLKGNIRRSDRAALATRLFTVYFGLQSHFSSYWQSRDDFLPLFIPVWISLRCVAVCVRARVGVCPLFASPAIV